MEPGFRTCILRAVDSLKRVQAVMVLTEMSAYSPVTCSIITTFRVESTLGADLGSRKGFCSLPIGLSTGLLRMRNGEALVWEEC